MRRALGIVVIFLVGATLAWLFNDRSHHSHGSSRTVSSDPPAVSEDPASSSATSEAERLVAESPGLASEENDVLPDSPPPPADNRWRLRVLAKGTPLAGARVVLADLAASHHGHLRDLERKGLLFRPDVAVNHYRTHTDESGEALLPWFAMRALLRIEGGAWGLTRTLLRWETLPDPLILEAEGLEELLVQVVSAAGQPQAGVVIELTTETGSRFSGQNQAVTASPDGMARFRHGYGRLSQTLREEGLRVGLAAPSRVPVVAIEGTTLPSEPIRLRLPEEFGALEVSVIDESGQPYRQSVLVRVSALDSASDQMDTPHERRGVVMPLHGGRVRMQPVAPDVALRVHVKPVDPGLSPVWAEVPPAPAAESLRRVTLQLGASLGRVTGVVEDVAGHPLRHAALRYSLIASGHGGRGSAVATDKNGRFAIPVLLRPPDPVEWTLRLFHARPGSLFRSVSHSFHPATEGFDLGTLRLEEAPAHSGGVLLDHQGIGLGHVWLDVDREGVERPFLTIASQAQTDSQGRFLIWGDPSQESIRLTLQHGPHWNRPTLELTPGRFDHRWELPALGTVRGQILLDPQVPSEALSLSLERLEMSSGDRQWHSARPGANGKVEWLNLLSGSFDLTVDVDYPVRETVRVKGVEVRAGEVTTDPRLNPLDLRGRIGWREWTIRVHDDRGEPLARARVSLRDQARLTDADGVARLPARDRPQSLELSRSGYVTREFADVEGDRSVLLERAFLVHACLDDATVWPGPPWLLRASLELVQAFDEEAVGDDSDQAHFDFSGACTLEVGRPGIYRLKVRVLGATGRDTYMDVRIDVGLDSIPIQDRRTPRVVRIPLTQELLEEALSKFPARQ